MVLWTPIANFQTKFRDTPVLVFFTIFKSDTRVKVSESSYFSRLLGSFKSPLDPPYSILINENAC